MNDRKVSRTQIQLYALLLEKHPKGVFAYNLQNQLDISYGTQYALLRKLEQEGIIQSKVEAANPKDLGRPVRRYYHLTNKGYSLAHKVVKGEVQFLSRAFRENVIQQALPT